MLLAVVLTLLLAAIAAVSAMRFDHTAQLTDDFRLLWTMGREDMIFEMQVRTHGYIGLGFARSSDSREAGADAIIGWVDKRTPYFQVSPIQIRLYRFVQRSDNWSACARTISVHYPPSHSLCVCVCMCFGAEFLVVGHF